MSVKIAETLEKLNASWWSFFYRRCLDGFPWFWPARPPGIPAMVAARRIARRQFGRDHPAPYRLLAQVLAAISWPIVVLVQLWEVRYSRGPEAAPVRRIPGAVWTALRHNVQVGEYFAYELWRPARKINIDNFLYCKEGPRLFKLLNQPMQPNPLDDKLTFHNICKNLSLPSPKILAVFAPRGTLLEFDFGDIPTYDLFIKPRIGAGGVGAELLRCLGETFENERGNLIKADQLAGYLARRALTENRTFLVQPALTNCSKFNIGERSSLATARLVTGLTRSGCSVPIFGIFFYIDRSDQIRVRHALIDVTTGQLTWPSESNRASVDIVSLPYWESALRYTRVAHEACSSFVFVGWDLAFTQNGPMLLEGNINWAADDYQRLGGEPLGNTKFADLLAARLEVRAQTSGHEI